MSNYEVPLEKGYYRHYPMLQGDPETTTAWFLLKKYINKLTVDQEFTRQELRNYIYLPNIHIGSTLDTYIHALIIVNVVEKIKPGLYKCLRGIPDKLTVTKLKKLAYSKSWETWFKTIDKI